MNDRKRIEWLLGELPGLKEKAIISPESADALQQHYQSILPPKTNFPQLVTIFFGILSAALTGAGIILISSDLPELIGMCDRILVIHHGEISGEVLQKDFDEKLILSYAAGINPQAAQARRL